MCKERGRGDVGGKFFSETGNLRQSAGNMEWRGWCGGGGGGGGGVGGEGVGAIRLRGEGGWPGGAAPPRKRYRVRVRVREVSAVGEG